MNQNQDKNKEIKNSIPYKHCHESNFSILSSNKSFIFPLCIHRSSFDYLSKSPEKTGRKKNFGISNSTIFIGARQNLKAMNIHLSNHSKYNNIARREITSFKNGKNKSVDKVNNFLSENEKKEELQKVLKTINLRWKDNEKKSKNNFSFISNITKENKDSRVRIKPPRERGSSRNLV